MIAFEAGERQQKESETEATPAEDPSPDGAAVDPPVPTSDVGNTRLDDGAWHHVAVTFRSGRIYAYADGRPDGDIGMEVVAAPMNALLMGPDSEEGGEQGDAPGPPEGLIDVQVYSSALSDEQIRGLATESKALSSGLTLPLTPWQVRDFWQLQSGGKSADAEGRLGNAAARALASECLGLGKDPCRGFQDEVICDFFVSLLEYAQSICLTPRKTAVFVAIMQWILTSMFRRSKTSACVGEPFSSSECFLEYKRLLLDHAATAAGALSSVPPRRLQIFSTAEVKRLTEFVSGTLFQQFFLYQCVLVNPQDEHISYASVTLERPRLPPLLRKAKLMPPKQDSATAATMRKPRTGDIDGQSNSSYGAAGIGGGDATERGGAAGADGGEEGEYMAADATQLPGKMRGGAVPGGAMKEEEHLDFLVAEASKAVHEHIEAQIQARDEAFKS